MSEHTDATTNANLQEASRRLIADCDELREALLSAQAAWLDRDRARERLDVIEKIQAAIRKATT
jgi:hypothetical protein